MSVVTHRPIRSFVRREGRLTPGQSRALAEEWPRFGITPDDKHIDLDRQFARNALRTLEIGFGNGDSLIEMAIDQPDIDFVGIEVHRPGVGKLLQGLADKQLTNVRVMCDDAAEVIATNFSDASFDRVQLFFPDPWHKKRHHKRRIVRDSFIQQVHRLLRPQGQFHMATDWQAYAESMMEQMEASPLFLNLYGAGDYATHRHGRPETKFERRGQRLGHGVWDLVYVRAQP